MDIEAYVEDFLNTIYEEASDDLDNCEDCQHLTKTTDAYSTGDSTTLYECEIPNERDCPFVLEAISLFKAL